MNTLIEIEELFKKHEGEHNKFERIENQPSNRPDLCAFIYLDKILPVTTIRDIVSCAEHDKIYLNFHLDEIKKFSEEDVLYLMRCGISFDCENQCLYTFV